MSASPEGHISITGVSKSFGRHKALDNVSLEIPQVRSRSFWGRPVRANLRCCAPLIIWSALTRGLSRLMVITLAIAARATRFMN